MKRVIVSLAATAIVAFASPAVAKSPRHTSETTGFAGFSWVGPVRAWTYRTVTPDEGPVLAGKESERFEIRAGDCGKTGSYNDCAHDREHVAWNETSSTKIGRQVAYSFSFLIPKDSPTRVPDLNIILAEFRNIGGGQINFSIELQPDGLVGVVGATKVQQTNDMHPPPIALWRAIDRNVKTDHWYNFALEVTWSPGKDGRLRLYLDDVLVVSLDGPNTAYKLPVHMQYGLYRPFASKAAGKLPIQIIYFDRVAKAKNREALPPSD